MTAAERQARDPESLTLAELVKRYLYGSDETQKKWLEVAKGRADYAQFQSRIERVLS